MWSGEDIDRVRDAERNDAVCPIWCDTDFRPRLRATEQELVELVGKAKGDVEGKYPLVVLTGGEPSLQVTPSLVKELRSIADIVAMETNGLRSVRSLGLDWVTVSPKTAPERLTVEQADELKVVYPNDVDPHAYAAVVAVPAGCLFLQPRALAVSVGHSLLDVDAMREAARFCMEHPEWRLSVQTHKVAGLP